MPTVGRADWTVSLGFLAYQMKGGSLSKASRIAAGESRCVITPGENTLAARRSRLENPLEFDLTGDEFDEGLCHGEALHAVTVRSGEPRNQPAQASIRWSGSMVVRQNWFQSIAIEFCVSKTETYRENC